MSVVLALAVVAPIGLLVLDRRRLRLGALVPAGLWLLLAVFGTDAELGPFAAGSAPMAVGVWLLLASITWPTTRATVALSTLAAVVVVDGYAFAADSGEVADAVGALAIAGALVLVAARSERDGGLVPASVALLGVAAVASGLVRDSELLLFLGVAVAAAAAAWRARRVGVLLLPAVLSLVGAAPSGWWPIVLVALAATVLAARPAVAIALFAVVSGGLLAPHLLLGASAVLVAVTLHPAVALTALPGVAVAIGVSNGHDSRWLFVIAALAAVTALRLWRPPEDALPGRPAPATIAALALGAWLLAAPETWLDSPALTSWGTGATIAGVSSVVGAFVVASFTDAAFTAPDLEIADPPFPARDPAWATPAALASLVVLGVAGVALVASTVS